MKNFIQKNLKLISSFCLIAILFPIIILYPSPIGIIPHDIGLQIVGYGGSILGGLLTLYGVWWTIKDNENQRREDLAIQYKPFLTIDIDDENSKKYDNEEFEKSKEENNKTFNGFYMLEVSKKANKILQLSFIIKNFGDGECYLNCTNSQLKSNLIHCKPKTAQEISTFEEAKEIELNNRWACTITRHNKIHINIYVLFNEEEVENTGTIQLDFTMNYMDQFCYNKYDGSVKIKFNLEKKENILVVRNPMFIIYNDPL